MNWSYLAGFFDADGCACIYKDRNAPRGAVTFVSTDKEVIEDIDQFLKERNIGNGVSIHRVERKTRDAYHLAISSKKDLLILIPEILSRNHIERKKKKLREMLELIKQMKDHNYNRINHDELLRLLREGKSHKEIAKIMNVSPQSISGHLWRHKKK